MRLLPIMGLSGELRNPLALQMVQAGPNFIAERATAIRPGADGGLRFNRMSLSAAQPEHYFNPVSRVSVVDGHGSDDCQMPDTLRFFGYTTSDELTAKKVRYSNEGIPMCRTVTLQPGLNPQVRTFNSYPASLTQDNGGIDKSVNNQPAVVQARFRRDMRRLLGSEISWARIGVKPLTFYDIQQIAAEGPVSKAYIQRLMEPMMAATELHNGIPKLVVADAVRIMCQEIRQWAAGK